MRLAERSFDLGRRGWHPRAVRRAVLSGPVNLPVRVYLVGFMGSGKTSVGRLLAEKLEWTFVDLDHRIEDRAGQTIRKIFMQSGERRFRSLECDALREVGRESGRSIVALGGGAFVSEVNRAVIRRTGVSVWLDVPFRTLLRRVSGDRRRPLAGDRERLHELYRTRLPFYHEADVRVRAGEAPAERLAAEVLRVLREDWSTVAERRRLSL
jgi:shikimate kinase